MDSINTKINICLKDTKFFINFDFDYTSKSFINSLKQFIEFKNIIDILCNINNYANDTYIDIPIYDNKNQPKEIKKLSVPYLRKNQKFLNNYLNQIVTLQGVAKINSVELYEKLNKFYSMKLFNFSLEQDLMEKIDDENKNSLIKIINVLHKCYKKYLEKNVKSSFKDYYLNNFNK